MIKTTTILTVAQESNIMTFLRALPSDIQTNIEVCLSKWLNGETTDGYPHPVSACENIKATHARQPFLTAQQCLDLQMAKFHLQAAGI